MLFWNNHVLKKEPPKAASAEDVMSLYPESQGNEVEADESVASIVDKIKHLKEEEKQLSDTIKGLEFEVKDYMKDADLLVDNAGSCLASWKNTSPRITLDTKKLKAEHQDIYMEYAKESKCSRMFKVK